jgi:hypothetical protein
MTDIQTITDARALEGTCYIEVLPGSYKNKCWNEGSLFFPEETFGYLEPIIEKHVPEYDHYAFTEIEKERWLAIIEAFETLAMKLEGAESFEEIKEVVGFIFLDTDKHFEASFEENRNALLKVVYDLTAWLSKSLSDHEVVTILGL